jgi:hypothetical protein
MRPSGVVQVGLVDLPLGLVGRLGGVVRVEPLLRADVVTGVVGVERRGRAARSRLGGRCPG